jgi:ParB/RepB/Spo0J family partition protein
MARRATTKGAGDIFSAETQAIGAVAAATGVTAGIDLPFTPASRGAFLAQMQYRKLATEDEITTASKNDESGVKMVSRMLNTVLNGVASSKPEATTARLGLGAAHAVTMRDFLDTAKAEDKDDAFAFKAWCAWRKDNPVTVKPPVVPENLPSDALAARETAQETAEQVAPVEPTTTPELATEEPAETVAEVVESVEETPAETVAVVDQSEPAAEVPVTTDEPITVRAAEVIIDPIVVRDSSESELPIHDDDMAGLNGWKDPGPETLPLEEEKVFEYPTHVTFERDDEDGRLLHTPLSFPLAPAVVEVPIGYIHQSELNPRQHFEESALQQLASDIHQHGQTPITVRFVETKRGAKYLEIVAGERRWRACQILGKKTARVEIILCSDEELVRRAMAENLSRVDLDPISRAIGLQKTMELTGKTQGEVGDLYGIKQATVSRLVGLLELPARAYNALMSGELDQSLGFALLPLNRLMEAHTKAGRKSESANCLRALDHLAEQAITEEWSKSTMEAKVAEAVALHAEQKPKQTTIFDTEGVDPKPPTNPLDPEKVKDAMGLQAEEQRAAEYEERQRIGNLPTGDQGEKNSDSDDKTGESTTDLGLTPPAETVKTEPSTPPAELPEDLAPKPSDRVDMGVKLTDVQWMDAEEADIDEVFDMARSGVMLQGLAGLVSPLAVALIAALTEKWNAEHPDLMSSPKERLDSILATRAEQSGIDTAAIESGLLAAQEAVAGTESTEESGS